MADTRSEDQQRNEHPYVIMALQGGGALGAFQAGAYQALSENGYEPDWVAGISIGAINASIIAGNPQEDRLPRLLKFWNVVAGNLDWWEHVPNYSEKLTNLWKVWLSMIGGVPGFLQPNFVPPFFAPRNSPEACSLYNAQKLKTTLQSLVRFDFLKDYNSRKHVRLSLGATKVFGGVSETFENFGGPNPTDPRCHYTDITIDHIMASGANAPWFPGVVIKNRLYWDGGITSNSSFKHIIHHLNHLHNIPEIGRKPILIFVIDLWGAYDREPKTFDEVCWRIKQIQYSSRIEHDIRHGESFLHGERLELKEKAKGDQYAAEWRPHIDIVRVSYRSDPNEIPCGDALFSRTEIDRRIADGHAAMLSVLMKDPRPWSLRTSDEGVKIHLF
jgi:NTE family protein